MKQEKATAVAELTEAFRGATAALLTEYRGLTMAQLTELRKQLGTGTRYKVTKNTLTKLAAKEAGYGDLEAWLSGPTAVAFVSGDPVEAAKGLRDFAKTNPALIIKGGVFEGKALDADAVRKIADLESREVLLARLAGAMNASTAKAAALFQAPLTKAAQLAAALQEKKAAEGSAAPADEAPAES